MLSGGIFGWLDVLEMRRVGCELVESVRSQFDHARLRRLLDVFDVFEHASLLVAHARWRRLAHVLEVPDRAASSDFR